MYRKYIKRLLDFSIALFAIIILSPLLLLLTVIGFIAMSGNPFFAQQRPGKDEKIFRLIKFRSMNNKKDKDGNLLPDEDRLTSYGKFLRSTSLDELPELFNILKGDMSIVGPRPERWEHNEMYSQEIPEFPFRLKVKGGLTGYAQVYGKYNTSPYDKLLMDLMYIAKPSIIEDLKICLFTVKILFEKESTEGVSEGETTAKKQ